MQTRSLGKCGVRVSPIGLGTVKFGRNQGVKYPQAFELPDDKTIASLLSLASELGINLLDTAPAYGASEERLGKALVGQRDRWVISTKVGESFSNGQSSFDFSASAMTASVERSLQRLRTDYVDIVLVHSDGNDLQWIDNEKVFDTLATLKREGKIRAYGMSTKTVAGGLRCLELADLAMVTYYPGYADEVQLIRYAHQQQKGILIKKAFASGHLDKLKCTVNEVMKFVFAEQGVGSVIIGTLNETHLRENVMACVQAL